MNTLIKQQVVGSEKPLFAFHKLKQYRKKEAVYNIKVGYKVEKKSEIKNTAHYLANAKRSARRCWQELMDIVGENDFSFFVSLTFTSDVYVVSDRINDNVTKELFTKWRKAVKRKFPNMKYIAVPEYHKKGGIHFHMLIGGVSADDLQLTKSDLPPFKFKGEEVIIYNVNAWKYGFSTASEIQSQEACEHYIAKYVTKGDIDPRFFGKKRYWCSANLLRPKITTFEELVDRFYACEYEDLYNLKLVEADLLYQNYKFKLKT